MRVHGLSGPPLGALQYSHPFGRNAGLAQRLFRLTTAAHWPEPAWAELGMDFASNMMAVREPVLTQSRAAVQRRHNGRWNTVFCDGHVEICLPGA